MSVIAKSLMTGIALLSFAGATPADSGDTSENVYTYRNLNLGDSIVLDMDRKAVMTGDTGFTATYCGADAAYFCVNSELFSFAVPKTFTRDTRAWTQDGFSYTVLRPLQTLRILGQDIDIAVIGSVSMSEKDRNASEFYYYSPTRGLLGFGGYTNKIKFGMDAMLSSTRLGFGAEK